MGEDVGDVSAMVELLLQAGASPEVVFLMHAISTENVEVALLLMAHGVDVKEPYGVWTPLHYAALSMRPRGSLQPSAAQRSPTRAPTQRPHCAGGGTE